MAIDISSGEAVLGNVYGGFSGPAIKPLALYLVYRVSQVVHIPIIGCGVSAVQRTLGIFHGRGQCRAVARPH